MTGRNQARELPDIAGTLARILRLRGRVESQHQMLSEVSRIVRPERAGVVVALPSRAGVSE